jgi:chromosome segregation ATPase
MEKENVKKFFSLKEKLEKARATIPEIEEKIRIAEAAQSELDATAIKAAALEEKGASKKEEIAKAGKNTISQLGDDLTQATKRVKILEEEAERIKGKACREVCESTFQAFVPVIREIAKKARELMAIEERARKIRREGDQLAWEIMQLPIWATPYIYAFTLKKDGEGGISPFRLFLNSCEAAGIDVD